MSPALARRRLVVLRAERAEIDRAIASLERYERMLRSKVVVLPLPASLNIGVVRRRRLLSNPEPLVAA